MQLSAKAKISDKRSDFIFLIGLVGWLKILLAMMGFKPCEDVFT
jgi:hypothetical protein